MNSDLMLTKGFFFFGFISGLQKIHIKINGKFVKKYFVLIYVLRSNKACRLNDWPSHIYVRSSLQNVWTPLV